MVFKNDFVVAVKSNGQILREQKNNVFLPFGSEYSLLLKNLNGRKALVNVSIDGRLVINGLIIHPNSNIELERFFDTPNKFKFIEKSDDIKEFRGDKIDDGIIRISYKFEKEIPKFTAPHVSIWNKDNSKWYGDGTFGSQIVGGINHYYDTSVPTNAVGQNDMCKVTSNICMDSLRSFNPEGITVEGSESKQTFIEGNIGLLEENDNVITIKLNGIDRNKKVLEPLSVKTKKQCIYCGRKYKNYVKYCSNCGSAIF